VTVMRGTIRISVAAMAMPVFSTGFELPTKFDPAVGD
jgi:hypothetical protein